MTMAASEPNRFRLKCWTAEFADPATEHAYRVTAFATRGRSTGSLSASPP